MVHCSLSTTRRVASSWMIAAVCATSLTINVLQAQRLRAIALAGGHKVKIGAEVQPLTVIDRHRRPVKLDLEGDRPTILYYFSATCKWCSLNWPALQELERTTRGRWRLVAITRDTEIPDIGSIEMYGGLNSALPQKLGFTGTPYTIAIGADARVLSAWSGAYRGEIAQAIGSYFGVVLPRLLPPDPAASSPGKLLR